MRQQAPDRIIKRLERLAVLLKQTNEVEVKAKAEADGIKREIRALADEYDFPVSEGSSEYVNVGKSGVGALRITRPDEPRPPLMAGLLIDRVGVDVVKRVAQRWLDKSSIAPSDFDISEWLRCVNEELVTADDLLACLGEPGKAREITVAFGAPKVESYE